MTVPFYILAQPEHFLGFSRISVQINQNTHLSDGYRESKASWLSVLQEAPKLATGDCAVGFWGASTMAWPTTQHQRCWVHKTANVLAALPNSTKGKAKGGMKEIWMAEAKAQAHKAFGTFLFDFEAKYPKAVGVLEKDRESFLAFYDFPAEHWIHIRTTNPIESSFATIYEAK